MKAATTVPGRDQRWNIAYIFGLFGGAPVLRGARTHSRQRDGALGAGNPVTWLLFFVSGRPPIQSRLRRGWHLGFALGGHVNRRPRGGAPAGGILLSFPAKPGGSHLSDVL